MAERHVPMVSAEAGWQVRLTPGGWEDVAGWTLFAAREAWLPVIADGPMLRIVKPEEADRLRWRRNPTPVEVTVQHEYEVHCHCDD